MLERSKSLVAILILCCSLLSGCGDVDLVSDVSQSKANQIVALLSQNGVEAVATRASGGRGRFTVDVDRSSYSRAVTLISEAGLPGEDEQSFSDLVASHGMLPNSREIEALRVDRALGLEIEEQMRAHPGVIAARVVVRMNFTKSGTSTTSSPSVSAVVQTRSEEDVKESDLQPLVLRAIPGIDASQIYITVQARQPSGTRHDEGVDSSSGESVRIPLRDFLMFWRVPSGDYRGLALTLVCCMALVGLLGGLLGFWYAQMSQRPNVDELRMRLPDVTFRGVRPSSKDVGRKELGE